MENELTLTLSKDALFKLIKEIRELKRLMPKDSRLLALRRHNLCVQEYLLNDILHKQDSFLYSFLDKVRDEKNLVFVQDSIEEGEE